MIRYWAVAVSLAWGLISPASHSSEPSYSQHDIYYGDVNEDGLGQDIYFHGANGFVYLQGGDGRRVPYSLSESSLSELGWVNVHGQSSLADIVTGGEVDEGLERANPAPYTEGAPLAMDYWSGPVDSETGIFSLRYKWNNDDIRSSNRPQYAYLDRRRDGGDWWVLQKSAWVPTPHRFTYEETGLATGTYTYRGRACNRKGCSYDPAYLHHTVTVTNPSYQPSAPSFVDVVKASGDLAIAVSWGRADPHVIRYELYRQSSTSPNLELFVLDGNTSGVTDTVSVGGTYSYRLRGCTAEDVCSAFAESSGEVVIDTGATAMSTSEEVQHFESTEVLPPDQADSLDSALSTEGEFVVGQSGDALYTVPIQMPKGPAGLAPELSFVYSSQAGNGSMGLGWSLKGQSAITRCRATEQQDKRPAPLQWLDHGPWCLDGVRIVRGPLGEHWLEDDNGTRITPVGAGFRPDYFIVDYADGSRAYMGERGDSQSEWKGVERGDDTPDPRYPYKWAISSKEDKAGNRIEYKYYHTYETQSLKAIYYGFSKSGDWKYEVNIGYRNRRTALTNFIGGLYYADYSLIDEVHIRDSRRKTIRRYFIEYNRGHERDAYDRVTKIRECEDVDGYNCLEPIQFDWTLPGAGFRTSPIQTIDLSPEPGNVYLQKLLTADVNGDGSDDVITLNSQTQIRYLLAKDGKLQPTPFSGGGTYLQLPSQGGSGPAPTNDVVKIFMLDYNGDGRDDLLYRYYDQSKSIVHLSKEGDDGWRLSQSGFEVDTIHAAGMEDFNGDGLLDAVAQYSQASSTFGVDIVSKTLSEDTASSVADRPYKFGMETRRTPVLIANGDGTFRTDYTFGINPESRSSGAADFNGDGLVDSLLLLKKDSPYTCPRDYRGRYDIFGDCLYRYTRVPYVREYIVDTQRERLPADAQPGWYYKPYGLENLTREFWLSSQFRLVDINSDGLTDIAYLSDLWIDSSREGGHWKLGGADWYYMINTGDGFSEQAKLVDIPSHESYSNHETSVDDRLVRHDDQARFVDINMDGNRDFVYFDFKKDRVVKDDGHFETGRYKVRYWDPVWQRFNSPVDFCPIGTSRCTFTYKHLNYSLATRSGGSLYTSYYVIPDTHFWDVNGDGKRDFIRYERSDHATTSKDTLKIHTAVSAPEPENVIVSIRESSGAVVDIAYEQASKSSHYATLSVNAQSHCSEPDECWRAEFVASSRRQFHDQLVNPFVGLEGNTLGKLSYVKELTQLKLPLVVRTRRNSPAAQSGDSPVDPSAALEKSYYYAQAKAQTHGRGFLGFKFRKEVNEHTGVQTITEFRQDWPFIGKIRSQRVKSRAGNLLIEKEFEWRLTNWSSTWPSLAQTKGTAKLEGFQPYLYRQNTKRYGLIDNGAVAGPLLAETRVTITKVDSFGNPLTEVEEVRDGSGVVAAKKVSVRQFGNSTEDARLGKLSRLEVTDEHGGFTARRVSTFDYYESEPLQGLLKTEVMNPGNPRDKLIVTHHYDAYGNETQSITRDSSGSTRFSQRVEYDQNGIHPARVYDYFSEGSGAEPVEALRRQVLERDRYGSELTTRIWLDERTSIDSHSATTAFGQRYMHQPGSGGYKAVSGGRGAGSWCPSYTEYYKRFLYSGGKEELKCFDALGQLVRDGSLGFDGGWNYVDYKYDVMGRLVGKTEPYRAGTGRQYWTTMSYDTLGREVVQDQPFFGKTTTTYHGYEKRITNSLYQTEMRVYDALGQVVRTQDNSGFGVEFSYDANGKLRETVDDNGVSTAFVHDYLGRKTSTNDPNKGSISYEYNSFGDVVRTQDELGQVTASEYDFKGRLVGLRSYNADGALSESRERSFDVTDNGWGKLSYERVLGAEPYEKHHYYDDYGRITEWMTIQGDGRGGRESHYERVVYDSLGRELRFFDAARQGRNWSGNTLEYRYNSQGHRFQWAEVGPDGETIQIYFTITDMDARANVSDASYGNGVSQTTTYYPESGLPESQVAVSLATMWQGNIQDRHYLWDRVGNMKERQVKGLTRLADAVHERTLVERFEYDAVNRLERYVVSGDSNISRTVNYRDNGNILSKSGVGQYAYGGPGPHQVTSAGGVSYSYNDLGQLLSDSTGRQFTYDTFGRLTTASGGRGTVSFRYGTGYDRVLRKDGTGENAIVTQYIGEVEKTTYPDGSQEWKRKIGEAAIETWKIDAQGALTDRTAYFILRDNLGSVTHLVDGGGEIIDTMDFDPWGVRRNTGTWATLTNAAIAAVYFKSQRPHTSRGYTGQEMMDELGLIHMNGRVYDPRLARFIQADPLIQDPLRPQSYNRYSYVWNNPMNAVDPTGFAKESAARRPPVESTLVIGKRPSGRSRIESGFGGGGVSIGVTLIRDSFSRTSVYTMAPDGRLYDPGGNKLAARFQGAALRGTGLAWAADGYDGVLSAEHTAAAQVAAGRDITSAQKSKIVAGDEFAGALGEIMSTEAGAELVNALTTDPAISSVIISSGGKNLGSTTVRGYSVLVDGTQPAWWEIWKTPQYTSKYVISININMSVGDPTFHSANGGLFSPSLTRVLAHELGHASNFQRYGSTFSNHNSIRIENQIMRQLDSGATLRHPSMGHGRGLGF